MKKRILIISNSLLAVLVTVVILTAYRAQAQETGLRDALGLQANPSFTYHSITTTYEYCSAIGVADVDRDGDVDLLSANEKGTLPNAGSIHWWQNAGSGSFTQKSLDDGPDAWGATAFYAGDMDDDGDTDVAAISTTYLGRLATFENQGGGSWKRREQASGLHPFSALSPVGWTVNGSDRLLAASANYPCCDGIYYGEPLTVTANARILPINAPRGVIYSVYPDDVDRDGDADIVMAARNSTASIYWYEWGTDAIADISVVHSNWPHLAWVQTGDLDRDNDPDIVAASDTQGLFWWANKDGKGTQWARYRISHEFYTAPSLHLADMDDDGDLDVLGATQDQMIWLENLGDPTRADINWVRHVVDTKSQSNSQGYALFPADVNGDGQMDIVGCDLNRRRGTQSSGQRLGWWENEHQMPSTDQTGWRTWDIDTTLVGAWGVDVADLDGDGRLDVAAAGYGDASTAGATRWYKSTAGAPLTPLTWTPVFSKTFASFQGRGVTACAAGRGQPHFLVSGDSNYIAPVLQFYGNGWDWTNPGQASIFTGSANTYMSAVADLYEDGTPDIISALTSIGHIVWWDGARDTERTIADGCTGARGVCAGDFDSDGDLDVAAACQNESHIHWWQNDDGYNNWTAKTVPVSFPGATAVECGDIDGDGVVEMVAANSDVAWFKPNATVGDGSTMGWITESFSGTEFIELHDLDRDGDLDVLATSPERDELAWLENTGTGNYHDDFSVHGLDEYVGGIREVAAGDLNGDGAPDIVVAAQDAGLVRWYEQIVDTQLSLEKYLDPIQAIGPISTGQSIPYVIEVTNNSFNGATADVLVVDRWEPPDAVAQASSDEDCIADFDHGVMTCTLPVNAGQIKPMHVVLTPSLLFDGLITNTAQVLPASLFWNSTSYLDTDAAAPVEVQQNLAIWDGLVRPGSFPSDPLFPGQYFSYTVGVVNLGPKSGASATMVNRWEPASAIDGFVDLGVTVTSSSLSTKAADAGTTCTTDADNGEVLCDLDALEVNEPLTVTIGVTTSKQFTDLLEVNFSLTGPDGDEGNPANNQTWPRRVGARPLDKVYLPLVLGGSGGTAQPLSWFPFFRQTWRVRQKPGF